MIRLLYKGQKPESLLVIAAVMTIPIVSVVKELVGRHRPTKEMVTVWYDLDSLSFPSGNSFTAVVIFGMFFYIAPLLVRSTKAVAVIRVASVTMIGLIGMSRVYLGAHWPSDVLGGVFVWRCGVGVFDLPA
jgi:undecaprenyl-diphosphatase